MAFSTQKAGRYEAESIHTEKHGLLLAQFLSSQEGLRLTQP